MHYLPPVPPCLLCQDLHGIALLVRRLILYSVPLTCLFSAWFQAGFVTLALQCNLKSGAVMSPAVFLLFGISVGICSLYDPMLILEFFSMSVKCDITW